MWEYSIITLILFGVSLLTYYLRYKQIDVYFLILSTYLCVSACSVLYAYDNPNTYTNLSIWGFIYLVLVVLICISPYRGKTIDKIHVPDEESVFIKLLFFIYLFSGVVSVAYTLPKAITLSQMDDWASIRDDVYNDFEGIELYTNQFERLCKNLYNYISPFGVVWTFCQLTKNKFNKWLVFSSLIVWSLEQYSSAMLIASRGMVFKFVVKFITLFIFFRASIPAKRKKYIYAFGGIVAIFYLSYALSVTESRFGDDANDSLYTYFGHSMLSFNNDVFGSMTDYADGRYLFKWIFEALGLDPTIDFVQLGSTHGTAFVTFVGCFFFDFGLIGTLILALLLNRLITLSTKNLGSYAGMIVFFYFASWFIDGVFVVGRSQSLSWLMLFVLMFIVKRIDVKTVKHI